MALLVECQHRHEPNKLDLFLLLIFLKDYFISFSGRFCPSAFCVRVSDDAQGRRMLSVTCRIPLVIRQGHQVSQQVTPPWLQPATQTMEHTWNSLVSKVT
jgi:hypothetical protein